MKNTKIFILIFIILGLSCVINLFLVYRAIRNDSRLNDLEKKEKVVTVGDGGDYSSILLALMETDPETKIHVLSGDYYIAQEYIDYYGKDFWNNYSGYENSTDSFMRGLWLDAGRMIYGDAGTNIHFELQTDNSEVLHKFSLFANAGDVKLENLNIFINTNCRYAILNDAGEEGGTTELINIVFDGGGANNAVIATNIQDNNFYKIDSCIFNNNNVSDDLYFGTNEASAKIIIKNCYGEKTCETVCVGPEDNKTCFNVLNSHFGYIRYAFKENELSDDDFRFNVWNTESNK